MSKRKPTVPEFTSERSCAHCHNTAPHRIIHRHSNLQQNFHEAVGDYGVGFAFVMIECPACNNITLLREHWHTGMDDAQPQSVEIAYPCQPKLTGGLPTHIRSAVSATERVKAVDPNAYGVLVRRGLELLCEDRGAHGRNLHDRLKDLGAKNEIPERLVKIALGLKNLGNIGAHAGLGDLSPREVPLMTSLFEAILEHVYGAPHLIEVVEQRMKELTSNRPPRSQVRSKGAT
jgi:hypothetical protein